MDLLAIPGSLRSTSSNRTLLEAAAALAPEGGAICEQAGNSPDNSP